MNTKNNNAKHVMKAILAVLLLTLVGAVNAETLLLSAAGVDVKSSTGVSIGTNLGAKFGYFASGFTAT